MKEIKLLIAAAAGAVIAAALPACSYSNQEWHNDCKVIGKDILTSTSGNNGQVHTTRTKRLSTSCGAFNVGDSLAGGFNSWDTWQALEVGGTYNIHTGGPRIGWADVFPTVLEIKPRA